MRVRPAALIDWVWAPWAPAIYAFAVPVVMVLAAKGMVILLLLTAAFAVLRGGLAGAAPPRALAYTALVVLALMAWGGLSALWADDGAEVWRVLMVAPLALAGVILIWSAVGLEPEARAWCGRGLVAGLGAAAAIIALDWALGGAIVRTLYPGHAAGQAPLLQVYNDSIAVLCVLAWPVALAARRWQVTVPVLAGAAVFAGVASDMALVAYLAAGAGALLAYELRRLGPALLAGAIAVLMLAGPWIVVALPSPGPWLQRLPDGELVSVTHRLAMWELAAERAAQRPALGWGFEASRNLPGGDRGLDLERLTGVGPERIAVEQEILPLHPHNGAVQLSLELGVVGGVLGALLLAPVPFYAARRRRPLAAAAGLAVVTGLAVPFMTGMGLWQPWWHAALWQFGALLAALYPRIEEAD